MIEVQELSKSYGPLRAVEGLTFKVGAGEVLGLLGTNGAGKTTTIRLLTTYLAPSAGTARIAGHDICREADTVRRIIGYLPESAPLYPELRVSEYLNFVARLRGLSGADRSRSIEAAVERCALGEVQQRLCGQLSKGYRQRVGLAQAILHRPQVLILDEPTSGLDPTQIMEIRGLISELRKDCTVLLSTHVMQEVIENCTQVLILAAGQLAVFGSLEEVTAGKSLEQRFLEATARTRGGASEKFSPELAA